MTLIKDATLYEQKMYELLNDNTIYEKMNNGITNTTQRKNNTVIQHCKRQVYI